MIAPQYVVPYVVSNAIAIALLVLATRRPAWVRIASVAIFGGASIANTWMATQVPQDYLSYAPLAVLDVYRDFMTGWFSGHIRPMVLLIAAGQLTIAVLLTRAAPWRTVGVVGGIVFLLAIAPLGVGSAFPFSLTYGAALVVMARGLARQSPAGVGQAVLEERELAGRQ